MENDPITTYKETKPSVDDSTKERQNLNKSNRKRKRQNDEITNPFFRPLVVTLHSQATNKSHTFIPIAHLPRADLPLIWLDHASKKTSIPPGALLKAQLEQVHCNAFKDHASILVARLTPNGGLYAVERAGEDLYIGCGLQPWITESRVIGKSLGTGSNVSDLQCLLDHRKEITGTKSITVAPKPRTPNKPKDRRGALARISIIPAKEVNTARDLQRTSQPPEPQESHLAAEGSVPRDLLLQDVAEADISLLLHQQSKILDLDYLRVQYLETLYLLKTSLAYLAKGPLARARNQAQIDNDESVRAKLLDFYRESIISTKRLDLKYKESVNKLIESAKSSQRPDECNKQSGSLEPGEKPKKKPGRKKMGKDALYPIEVDYIQRCWAEREVRNVNSLSAESQAQEQRKLVSDLRTRETKMQILLILEVLALEAVPPTSKETALNSDKIVKTEEQVDDTSMVLAKTPAKRNAELKQKTKDYGSDLDTLIERLCIWHTVGIDDTFDSTEKVDQETQRSSSGEKDQLRDFCADVIIPFYASRLPEQCKMICRKLGGPEVSPKRPKAALTKSMSTSRVLPGAVKQRPRAVLRKTLERVLSDDRSMRHGSAPIFSRSSTAPLVPTLKREPSENSSRPASRGALHKSVSFSNREIDLEADARVQEAKRRKLARVAEQKKELDAAIAALKKPNRGMAAQGLMDEIESRSSDSNPRKQVVHITATPRRPKSRVSNRHEDVLPSKLELDAVTEDQVIPSSAVRPRGGGSDHRPGFPQASAKKRAVLFAIHETPARPSSAAQATIPKPISRLNFSSNSYDVTISSDPTLVESTPTINRLCPDPLTEVENTPMRMSKSLRPVLFTPLKKMEVRVEEAFRDAPIIPADAGKAMDRVMGGASAIEMSVYDALGWNDEDL